MAPSADSQILPMILSEVKDMRKDLGDSLQRQAKAEQRQDDHNSNTAIHAKCDGCKADAHSKDHAKIVQVNLGSIIGTKIVAAGLVAIALAAMGGISAFFGGCN